MVKLAGVLIGAATVMLAFAARPGDLIDQTARSLGPGPSFSCNTTDAIETVICRDPQLSARDRTMSTLFAAVRIDPLGVGPSGELETQRRWLKDRNRRCLEGERRACLVSDYDDRLAALAVAALFTHHAAAMAELARQAPKTAPLYEAIYRYATIDGAAARTAAVASLIAPAFEAVHDLPTSTDLLVDVASPQAAAASDKTFAAFLAAASVSDYQLNAVPCAALVRRPGLIGVLDARYGSGMDNQLLRSDCAETMPPTPHLDSLVSAVLAAQPVCEGSIRFGAEHQYQATLVAIRLHRTEIWKPGDPYAPRADRIGDEENTAQTPNEARFIALRRAAIGVAVDELAADYVRLFKISPEAAAADARGAVRTVIGEAYDLCEAS